MTAPLRRSGILVTSIKRSCENKRRYPDMMVARGAGQILGEQNQVELFMYPCGLCRGWHLTRKKQGRKDYAVSYEYRPTPR